MEEKSKVLRDQIVTGVVSNGVREKLLDQAALTLNTAVDLSQQRGNWTVINGYERY